MANVAQPKQYISREKTPKWLHERNQSNTTRKMTEEEKKKHYLKNNNKHLDNN
jgi:hypothetical protein